MQNLRGGFFVRLQTSDNDTIQNGGYWYDGEGSEYTYHDGGSNVTINGLDGDDSIVSYSDSVSIDSGAGNDIIFTWGSSLAIDGLAGNDFIETYGDSVKIDGGEDNDDIWNEGWNSTLNGGAGNDYISNYGDNVIINGESGSDSIFNGCYLNEDGSIQYYDEGKNVLFKYSSGDGKDKIYGFRADSTLQIAGSSYSTKKIGDDIVVTVGDGKISLMGAASLDNLNIFKDVIYTDSSKANVTLGADITVADATARTNAIKIVGNSLDNSIFGGSGKDKLYGKDGNDTLSGSKGNDTLSGGNGDDLFVYTAGNDVITDYAEGDMISIGADIYSTVLSGENVVFKMIDGGNLTIKVPFKEVNKDIIFIDSSGYERTIYIDRRVFPDIETWQYTASAKDYFIDASSRTKAIEIVGNALDNTILGGYGKDTLFGEDGNDTLGGGAGADKLYGQEGDDSLFGGKGNDKLYGGEDDDILFGGEGNDTLWGGNGDDIFVYDSGNDVILDYEEDSDKISLGAAISKSSINGSDATFIIGNDTLTVKDGFGKEIVFIDENGKERTIIGGAYLADNSSSSKSTLASWREVGDASERTKAIQLTGNALDNTILGGSGKDSLYGGKGNDYIEGNAGNDKLYGQAGNDTLWGGTGNDTLIGGEGADVFIYASGDGKDVISGFDNNDMLQITGTFSASYDSTSKALAFTVGDGSLTIKDFTATTFNVNGIKYKIKGNNFVRK